MGLQEKTQDGARTMLTYSGSIDLESKGNFTNSNGSVFNGFKCQLLSNGNMGFYMHC